MPKPLFGDNGSGMHCHQTLWKDGEPLFYDENGYALLSDMCQLLHRRPAEARAGAAGVLRADHQQLPPAGAGLRGAGQPGVLGAQPLRLRAHPDVLRQSRRRKRLEFRPPDPTCNPYLAFSAMLMAGLDGIQNKIEPPKPLDEDIYELESPRRPRW